MPPRKCVDQREESLAARRQRLLKAQSHARDDQVKRMARAGADWADLPHEILVAIFAAAASLALDGHAAEDAASSEQRQEVEWEDVPRVGAVPLIPRVTRVCRSWRDATRSDPAALWQRVDISSGWCRPTDHIISRYCKGGAWAALTHINMADCTKLTDVSVRALAAGCPRLTCLDARGIGPNSNISGDALHTFDGRLTHVTLDRLRPKLKRDVATIVASVASPALRYLSMADVPRLTTQVVLSVAQQCAALTTLDLSRSASLNVQIILPWVALMRGCPGLRELRMTGFGGDLYVRTSFRKERLWAKLRRVCGTSSSLRISEKAAVSRHAGSFFKRFSHVFFEFMGTGESMMFFRGTIFGCSEAHRP